MLMEHTSSHCFCMLWIFSGKIEISNTQIYDHSLAFIGTCTGVLIIFRGWGLLPSHPFGEMMRLGNCFLHVSICQPWHITGFCSRPWHITGFCSIIVKNTILNSMHNIFILRDAKVVIWLLFSYTNKCSHHYRRWKKYWYLLNNVFCI
jgi:hypothetical protein